MTSNIQSSYSNEQIAAWLRGLLTIAWADGNFDVHEQQFITSITNDKLAHDVELDSLEVIKPQELATILGQGTTLAENFLRTAVMVAIADGTYSASEDEILHQFCRTLEMPEGILESLRHTLEEKQPLATSISPAPHPDAIQPLREWLDGLDIQDPRVARFLCKMIPSQCPFERDVTLFGHKIVHIPPLCKINPLYEQLVSLRFRSLCYLADKCGEDVSPYI